MYSDSDYAYSMKIVYLDVHYYPYILYHNSETVGISFKIYILLNKISVQLIKSLRNLRE